MTKTTFFSFIIPILLSFTSRPSLSVVLCANQKLERKTFNHACDLVVDHLGCGPSGQVGPKQLFMLSGGDRIDSVMIQSNCGEYLGTKSGSDRFVLYTEIN